MTEGAKGRRHEGATFRHFDKLNDRKLNDRRDTCSRGFVIRANPMTHGLQIRASRREEEQKSKRAENTILYKLFI